MPVGPPDHGGYLHGGDGEPPRFDPAATERVPGPLLATSLPIVVRGHIGPAASNAAVLGRA